MGRTKIYIRAPFSETCLSELRKFFEVVYEPWTMNGERFYEDEMLDHLLRVRPDALITELDRVTAKVLTGYPKLRLIGDCRAMPANIDIAACTAAKVPVLCTPARNAQAVAEMLVGLLLAMMRNLIPSVQWVKDGKWVAGATPYYLWMGSELNNKKVGFVGFGAVGRAAAKLLDAFGCDISFYDPFVELYDSRYRKRALEEVFSECDIVSIHLPVTEATRGLVSEKLLRSMKKNAVFANTARSAVVDYAALKKILEEKRIRGAILDVLDTEPPSPEDLEIGRFPNVILTPHICGATYEVTDHQSEIMTKRIKQWLSGEGLEQIVYNRGVLNG